MEANMQLLEKKSIEAALNKNWDEAVKLNTKIFAQYIL
jgi:hypothetical protein